MGGKNKQKRNPTSFKQESIKQRQNKRYHQSGILPSHPIFIKNPNNQNISKSTNILNPLPKSNPHPYSMQKRNKSNKEIKSERKGNANKHKANKISNKINQK
jgi:hypothetical protein